MLIIKPSLQLLLQLHLKGWGEEGGSKTTNLHPLICSVPNIKVYWI